MISKPADLVAVTSAQAKVWLKITDMQSRKHFIGPLCHGPLFFAGQVGHALCISICAIESMHDIDQKSLSGAMLQNLILEN
jgi:hypothetical protein